METFVATVWYLLFGKSDDWRDEDDDEEDEEDED